jgi:hypothetical protein
LVSIMCIHIVADPKIQHSIRITPFVHILGLKSVLFKSKAFNCSNLTTYSLSATSVNDRVDFAIAIQLKLNNRA